MTTELPGPFVLTEREQEEVYQARLETNPALYPDSRTAILTGAIERALRTLGPASGPWSEVVVDRPSAPMGGPLSEVQRTALNEASEHFDSVGADVYSAALDELLTRFPKPLVLAPAEPQPDAPTIIADLPAYWDERRAKQQKPDKSRCAAELRIALASSANTAGDDWDETDHALMTGALVAVESLSESEEAAVAKAERGQWAAEGEVLPLLAIIRRRFAKAEQAETVVRPSDKPDDSYKSGFSDGFARGVEYGRALAQLGKP